MEGLTNLFRCSSRLLVFEIRQNVFSAVLLRRFCGKTVIADALREPLGEGRPVLRQRLPALLRPNTLLIAPQAQRDLTSLYYLLQQLGCARLLVGLPKLDLQTVCRDRLREGERPDDLYTRCAGSLLPPETILDWIALMQGLAAERDDLHRYCNLFGYEPDAGMPAKPIRSVTYLPFSGKELLYDQAGAPPEYRLRSVTVHQFCSLFPKDEPQEETL